MNTTEPFSEAEAKFHEFEDEFRNDMLRMQSMVVAGQNMSNLLCEINEEFEDDLRFSLFKSRVKEWVARWEKEFEDENI